MLRRGFRALAWAMAAGCLVSDAPAARTAPQDQQPPTFRTEANYVRVDVFPTSNGAPVADLSRDEFEVLPDKVPQRIDAFERVVVRGHVPQEQRAEPTSVAEARAMVQNPRARVFVVFLDTYHIDVAGSHAVGKPLVAALDAAIGEDDLVAVMTPDMSPADLAFARRTTTIEGMLTRHCSATIRPASSTDGSTPSPCA